MSFQSARATLQALFAAENFEARVRAGEQRTVERLLETCTTGARLYILFPGYKAGIRDGKLMYDYRIDFEKDGVRTALSHANIVVDLYYKVARGAVEAGRLEGLLWAFAVDGEIQRALQLHADGPPPPAQLLARIDAVHVRLGKHYNWQGNQWGLTLEELFTALKWIVLQEDFNYPIGRFEGRRMCFARYVEAVYVAAKDDARLEELVARTLSHGRPQRWPGVDYAFLDDVK